MKAIALAVVSLLVATTFALANDAAALLRPPLWADPDDKPIPEPLERDVSEAYDVLRNTWLRHLDFGYTGVRHFHRPSLNVNAWDEVPDSSWFTNRIGRREVGVHEMLEGPPLASGRFCSTSPRVTHLDFSFATRPDRGSF